MDASWRLNVRSHFVAARAAMPIMREQGRGSIIITSSNSGVQYDRGMIAYATTKHAAVAMARQIAVDYASHGVRCNALCPGFVDTPMHQRILGIIGDEIFDAGMVPQVHVRRVGRPEEIASAILYLCSDEASFITGTTLTPDGGFALTV